MWKFQDFSIFQILREINSRESRRHKNAVLGALKFVNFILQPSKGAKIKKKKNQNLEPLNVLNWQICTSRIPKIDFT